MSILSLMCLGKKPQYGHSEKNVVILWHNLSAGPVCVHHSSPPVSSGSQPFPLRCLLQVMTSAQRATAAWSTPTAWTWRQETAVFVRMASAHCETIMPTVKVTAWLWITNPDFQLKFICPPRADILYAAVLFCFFFVNVRVLHQRGHERKLLFAIWRTW